MWQLLLAGFSVTEVDDVGNNALMLACTAGHVEVVKAVAGSGCNPWVKNHFGNDIAHLSREPAVRAIATSLMSQLYCSGSGVGTAVAMNDDEGDADDADDVDDDDDDNYDGIDGDGERGGVMTRRMRRKGRGFCVVSSIRAGRTRVSVLRLWQLVLRRRVVVHRRQCVPRFDGAKTATVLQVRVVYVCARFAWMRACCGRV